MNNKVKTIFILSSTIFMLSSCANDTPEKVGLAISAVNDIIVSKENTKIVDNKKYLSKLDKNMKNFYDFKKNSNHSYTYTSSFSSWVGFGSTTKVFVETNNIVKREYKAWDNKNKITKTFIENKNTINSNKEGFKARTLDDLYKECKKIIKTKNTGENRFYLSFDNKGLLNTCIYVPKNCADDCSFGIKIKNIKAN